MCLNAFNGIDLSHSPYSPFYIYFFLSEVVWDMYCKHFLRQYQMSFPLAFQKEIQWSSMVQATVCVVKGVSVSFLPHLCSVYAHGLLHSVLLSFSSPPSHSTKKQENSQNSVTVFFFLSFFFLTSQWFGSILDSGIRVCFLFLDSKILGLFLHAFLQSRRRFFAVLLLHNRL